MATALWRATFGHERRRQFMATLMGDDAPLKQPWLRFEYKRRFGRKFMRWLMASDSPGWVRLIATQKTREFARQLHPERMDALEISGETWRDFGFKSYRAAHFGEFDVCGDPLPETYDFIVAEHLFEHLLWPYRAGRNLFSMLRPGGYLHLINPFMYPVHAAPVDCSRWTELGLKHLLAECGFRLEDCQTGAWGNRACLRRVLRPGRSPNYRSWLHSLENEPDCPIVVWIFARKPAAAGDTPSAADNPPSG